jgi:hypothetical protein
MLGIQHPEGKDETDWSAFDIADGTYPYNSHTKDCASIF